MQPIAGLRAEPVPHIDWVFRAWYQGSERYYHGPRREEPRPLANRIFFDRVDSDLRPLCRLLIDNGLRTTPSCQGHFHPRQRFAEIWDDLLHEQDAIRHEGLVVRDAETDAPYLFRDDRFRLPWDGFSSFLSAAYSDEGTGYLGILLDDDRHDVSGSLSRAQQSGQHTTMHIDPAGRRVGSSQLYHIQVSTDDPDSQSRAWRDVTQRIEEILAEAQADPDHGFEAAAR